MQGWLNLNRFIVAKAVHSCSVPQVVDAYRAFRNRMVKTGIFNDNKSGVLSVRMITENDLPHFCKMRTCETAVCGTHIYGG